MLTRLLNLLLAVLLLCAVRSGTPALADEVQRIAAIVNDEVVSGFDVKRRIDLIVNSTRLADNPETRKRLRGQVLRGLVDEKLQIQEARRNNIEVQQADIDRAFASIAQQNKVTPDAFAQILRDRGISRAALEQQLKAEIAWNRLVQRRVQPTVTIGDEEIDEVLARLKANAGKPENRLSEIFLPVDSVDQEEDVLRSAERLVEQLRAGASFPDVARQFSGGSTAGMGGDVGWVQPGQLAPDLDRAAAALAVGEISDPIRSVGGYYILKLQERRRILGSDPMQTELTLSQIVLPLPPNPTSDETAALERTARSLAESVTGCDQVAAAARTHDIQQYGDLGTVKLGELPPDIQSAVADLEIGRFSEPVKVNDSLMLLMVCARDEQQKAMPDRETIRQELARRRIGILAQRYLRDLRRAAVVELR